MITKKDTIIYLSPIKKNDKWVDEFYSDANNFDNFNFKNSNESHF